MKRDWLKKQLGEGVSDDVIDAIMAQNGSDVNSAKGPGEQLRAQLDEANTRMAELESAASASLTEQEKWQKQLDAANAAATKATRDLNEMCAVAEFGRAGLSEEEYRPFLYAVVGDSREKTVAAASAICAVINAKVTAATEEANKAAMAGMGAPAGGEGTSPVTTKKDFDALSAEDKIQWVHDNPGSLSQLK